MSAARDGKQRLSFFAASTVALLLLLGGAMAAEDEAPLPWSERGLFVFGMGVEIVFDFQNESEHLGPIRAVLINCSNEEFYCGWGHILGLVLPRVCHELDIGDTWAVGGLGMRVLGSYQESAPALTNQSGRVPPGGSTIYLLGNPSRPHTVYEYDGNRGVRAIYFNIGDGTDFIDLAESGDIQSYRAQVEGRGPRYFRLATPDLFGPCERPRESEE